jgi:hypothetical protein
MRWLIRLGVLAAAICAASPAFAAPGFSISWSSCHGEGTGASNRSFACDTNAGTNVLVVSFELPADLPQVSGNEIVIDILTAAATLPAWWDLKNAGTCRVTSLAMNTTADANNVVCVDWARGASVGGIGSYDQAGVWPVGDIDPSLANSHRRLKLATAVPLAGIQDLVAATEYFAANITIDNLKSVGTGSCAGCTEPMCIVINSLKVTTPGAVATDITIGNPSSPGSNIVTWQGTGPNCQAVPVKNATWGQVKALYR